MADEDEIITGYTDEGLVLLTYSQIVDSLTRSWQHLFGDDIDLSSNTPDGQLLRIFAEMIADEHDTVREVDNSFNPDVARGAAQDYRYRLNNIERKAGLYTSVPISFTVLNETSVAGIDGQDMSEAVAWGVTDGIYNYLINSSETFEPGTYTRQVTCTTAVAANPPIGTITRQILDVNNINITDITNSAPTRVGAAEEGDERFAARRELSTVNSGMNCCDSITNQLLELPTVTNAKAYEHDYSNYPESIDADGIPLNTIWVVTDGGSAEEIARTIYENISGTGTKGSQSYTLTSASGQSLTFRFDYAITRNIYLRFQIQKLYPSFNLRVDTFKQTIADETSIDINAPIDSSTLNTIIRQAIMSNSEVVQIGAVPLDIQISTDQTNWVEYLPAAGKQIKYVLLAENISVEVLD